MSIRLIFVLSAFLAAVTGGIGVVGLALAHPLPVDSVRASCFAFGPVDAGAASPGVGSPDGGGPGTARTNGGEWLCEPVGHGSVTGPVRILFDSDDLAAAAHATHFVSHVARFDTLSMAVRHGDRTKEVARYTLDDIDMFVNGPNFALPLPDLRGADALIVTVTKPWNRAIASDAMLEQAQNDGAMSLGRGRGSMLLMAFLCGLMLVPLIYNLAFYRVLRKTFIIWHSAAVISMLIYIKIASGLGNYLLTPNIHVLLFLYPFSFLTAAFLGTQFTVRFLEPGMLGPGMRRALVVTGWTTFAVLGTILLPLPMFRTFSLTMFSAGFLPLTFVYVAAMMQARRRGSRAVWFQIIGWTPLLLLGLERIAKGVGLSESPPWVGQLFFLTLAFEVLMTSLGVVDRFDILRRDHDQARSRLEMLSGLVDRDALTGIFNRRALEQKFAELRAEGFTGLAVLDLDFFKQVNDRFGHSAGDRVLQEVAKVLSSDDEALPFRMGGEEFVLLVRGNAMQERCERIRSAIPIRVANQMPGIDLVVTASMGLVDTPPGTRTSMRQLYAHADRLLYEAKNSGRDRMISERMQFFSAPGRTADRRNPQTSRGRRAEDNGPTGA
ncbi:sensor domain-containing diguanylate cyclase [Croceicoccus hydrothermalis]|uniref:GGDEF domain-containing protein n=1 Tax=Croceicoccus hydrothermalis TaxID=2867964 RepID=UPI001EFB1B3F|nr:diguanylate cyclase [Croceicoccus hydrothermalis]